MIKKLRKIVDSRFGTCADKFCNSVWYIAAMGAVCVLCHTLNIPVVGAALLAILLIPALLFCKNSFVLTPFLLMCSFVLSEETKVETGYYNTPANISVLCIVLVAVLAALVFNVVVYGKWKVLFKKSYLTVSLSLLTGALLMGGIGSASWTIGGLGLAIAIAVTMFLPYALMINCGEYKGRKTVVYFAWCIIVAALAICICFAVKFISNDLTMFDSRIKTCFKLGFVGPNTGAAIITLAIPMTFYLVYIYKHGYAFLLLVALELFFILLSISRASLVVAIPGTVIVSIWMCFKKKNGRLGYFIAFGIAVAAAIAVAIIMRKFIFGEISNLFSGNNTGSGRTTLWREGFNAWKEVPIFGVCLTFLQTVGGNWFYSFHCTPLTYLYCMGIVGLAAYLYHRYKTVRLVFSAKLTPERVFVALTVLAMLANALLDIAMTSATHLIYYAIMLAIIEHDVRYTKAAAERNDNACRENDKAKIETENKAVINTAATGDNNE